MGFEDDAGRVMWLEHPILLLSFPYLLLRARLDAKISSPIVRH
jgi:hypothetical protein